MVLRPKFTSRLVRTPHNDDKKMRQLELKQVDSAGLQRAQQKRQNTLVYISIYIYSVCIVFHLHFGWV